MKNRFLLSIGLLFILISSVSAQEYGQLSGSFESNSNYYFKDNKLGIKTLDDRFASNNYLTCKYTFKNFTAGLRYESYLPALIGYDRNMYKGSDIANRYISFNSKDLFITVGNFYEQFGSGLILRSFEERQLGIDNSLDGVKLAYNFKDIVRLKGVAGQHRFGFERGVGKVRGADFDISLKKVLFEKSSYNIVFGGSFVSRFQDYSGPVDNVPTAVDAYSARCDFESENANISVEYVEKGKDFNEDLRIMIPKGKALLVNGSSYFKGLTFNYIFRCVDHMTYSSQRNSIPPYLSLNYIPVLVKQHSYSLSNIYVYASQTDSEIGAQFDLMYKFKRNSFLGGKYGTQLAFNCSILNALEEKKGKQEFLSFNGTNYYKDFSFEMTKKWNKKFKTIFTYHFQEYNKGVLEHTKKFIVKPQVCILDMTYKMARRKSLRVELQHLYADNDMRSWMAALVELSFAPRFSFYVGDDYNYGNENSKIHYYSAGATYSHGATKLIASYGRQRGGITCVGGVCRMIPSMNAFSLSISTRF